MHFEWHVLLKYYPVLLKGLVVTVEYTLITLLTSLCFGTGIAALRALKIRLLDPLLIAYINVGREVPLLVQLYFIFFGLPALGVSLSTPVAAVLAITLNEGAFVAEIVRGGIQSIARGQWEAARSISMNRLQTLRYIILPQAIKKVIPSLVGHTSYILKDTAILTVIAVDEITSAAGYINDMTLSSLTAFGTAAAMYVVLFWFLQHVGARVERAFRYEGVLRWT
jgi:His/Glu/Gln/Arg/opine family amino acid ABC transporter permease subunit